jgi:HAD superfamily hydrolase (TIGR01549 family)
MKPEKNKLICFDMDHTLIKANKMHIIAFNKAFQKNNLPRVKNKVLKKLFGIVGERIVKELFPNITKQQLKKVMRDHDNFVIKETKKYAKPFFGVKKTLKKLKKSYKLALVSNCKHKEMLAILKAAKIDRKLFSVIIGNDDVKHGKPCPDEILKAEKLTHLNAAWMIGDSIYDIIAGKKAKAKTIAVTTGNHSREELKKYKPDYIIHSLRKLPKIIK